MGLESALRAIAMEPLPARAWTNGATVSVIGASLGKDSVMASASASPEAEPAIRLSAKCGSDSLLDRPQTLPRRCPCRRRREVKWALTFW